MFRCVDIHPWENFTMQNWSSLGYFTVEVITKSQSTESNIFSFRFSRLMMWAWRSSLLVVGQTCCLMAVVTTRPPMVRASDKAGKMEHSRGRSRRWGHVCRCCTDILRLICCMQFSCDQGKVGYWTGIHRFIEPWHAQDKRWDVFSWCISVISWLGRIQVSYSGGYRTSVKGYTISK